MLRLIKRCSEYVPQEQWTDVPRGIRGIYVLYRFRPRVDRHDVVYIGMSDAAVRGRLKRHSDTKSGEWSHFSVFEVWDNIRTDEIKELEGLFRHIYRRDTRANRLNKQKAFS